MWELTFLNIILFEGCWLFTLEMAMKALGYMDFPKT